MNENNIDRLFVCILGTLEDMESLIHNFRFHIYTIL